MPDAASSDLTKIIEAALARAPDWVRQDLTAKDPRVRARAEGTLAAMIAAALDGGASHV